VTEEGYGRLTTQQVLDLATESMDNLNHRLVYDRRYNDAALVFDAIEFLKKIDLEKPEPTQ
jgi:hypothetical protein